MTKIKVAHVLNSIGGLDIWMRLTADTLDTQRFETIIIHGTEDTNREFFDADGTKIKEYKLAIKRNLSPWHDIKLVISAYRILKKEKPGIIHCHSAKGGVIGRLAGRLLGIPVLYTPHAFSYLSTDNPIKRLIFLGLEKLLANGNSILASTSASENERGIKEAGYKMANTIILHNSVHPVIDIPPLTLSKTWPDNYICTVGRPSYQKNIELMLHAVNEIKKHHNIHLVLLGAGIVQDRIHSVRTLIDTLDLKNNVTMVEWTQRENVLNILSNARMYISTSRYEGMPYSVIESLALGIPCVVSNCDGNKDLIVSGYNGYVITSQDPRDYAAKIIALLSNETLQEQFSANAKKTFNEHHNLTKNIKKLEQAYIKYATK